MIVLRYIIPNSPEKFGAVILMALNKFMHPRNIYRTPPDFEKLSKEYTEFSKITKVDVTGKIVIDFKDPHSLRVLTKCLLKSDFNLDVNIPEDRLVPTLPLRLNYILWIEDLMAAIKRDADIHGIDIGTGACAVYPLLAAVKNKWHMLATEVDIKSLQNARENLHRNNLQELVELSNNKGSTLIENLFTEKNARKYDFCMCNPPFYSNIQELYESRSPARLPPKNGFTGSPQELITEGGELKFCRKLIEESKKCKDNVLIFTTMVGHKYNLSEMLQDLKADGIKHTHTEFCQGRVTRWGLAWTHQDYDLYKLVPPRDKPRKKNLPITHHLPPIPNCDYNVETAYNRIKTMLTGLKVEQRILNKCGNRISLDILAKENTWSNQRKKRRLMKRMDITDPKKSKNDEELNNHSCDKNAIESTSQNLTPEKRNDFRKVTDNNIHLLKSDKNGLSNEENSEKHPIQNNTNQLESVEDEIMNKETNERGEVMNGDAKKEQIPIKNSPTSANNTFDTQTHKSIHSDDTNNKSLQETQNSEPIVHAFMKLYKKEDIIQLEVEFLDGTGGKESVHQVVQYIKNNWK